MAAVIHKTKGQAMTDLDKLRPEVRKAVAYDEWWTVRAELLRLAARNAELEAKATRDHAWISDLLADNKRAEAELAALKAKIAEAPVVVMSGHRICVDSPEELAMLGAAWICGVQRVRLLVDEPSERGEE